MRKLLLIPVLMFLVSGCLGGGGYVVGQIPTLIDYIGDWILPEVEEELGINITAVANETKAIVKQTLLPGVDDLGHAVLDSATGTLDINFTSVKNGDKVEAHARKKSEEEMVLDVLLTTGEIISVDLIKKEQDET